MLPLVFTSCGSDDDEPKGNGKYQVVNNTSNPGTGIDDLNGTLYDCVVAEFDKNSNLIGSKYIGNVARGEKSSKYTASNGCGCVMLTFYMLPDKAEWESINDLYAIGDLFYITEGQTTQIKVTDNSPVINLDDDSRALSPTTLMSGKNSVEYRKLVNQYQSYK